MVEQTEAHNEHREASQSPAQAAELFSAYRQMLAFLFLASFGLIGIITISLLIAYHYDMHLSILAFVALVGALGAFFSSLTRLYSLEQLPAALLRPDVKLGNWHLLMYALIPPIVGAIGAVFFYLCVASGLIEGSMFQHFVLDCKAACPNSNSDDLNGLLCYKPANVTDYAKSLVWGFVAGFSERLVPDTLSRFEKSGKAQ
jgi:hypothetical protein